MDEKLIQQDLNNLKVNFDANRPKTGNTNQQRVKLDQIRRNNQNIKSNQGFTGKAGNELFSPNRSEVPQMFVNGD